MEASSVFIKTEIEDAEYERSYNYSSNDTLVNNEEDYTVTVNPEAVLDIKYEREEDPTSNNSESIAAFSSNASGLTGDNDVSDSSQPKEPPVHKEVNRRKRKLRVRRLDARQIEETCEENEESAMVSQVKTEPEEFSTIWNSEDTNSFDGTAIKMEDTDNGLGSDSNYMEGGSNGTTEVAPGEDFVIKTESEALEDESSAYSNHVQSTSKRKRRSLEENSDAFQNVPVGNLMSLQEFEGDASKSIRGRTGNRSSEAKEKTRKTWFLDEDKGMWKRRSWYEEEAKNMMQKTQEDLKQIEELYSSKSGGQSKETYISILQSSAEKPETKENKREVKRLVGRKRSRYEEKTELMKRKTEEDEEFIDSLKTMFKRPADTSEHSNQSIDSTSSPPESGASENCDKSAILSTSLLTLTELSEFNERRRGSNKVPIEEDKWKELSSKSSEELEQEIAELNGKRRLTVPRKSMYEEKTRDMNRKTQEDEELIKGLQSLRKLVSKDSKEYKQLLSDTSVLSESIKEQVEISPNTFEYQPGPGVPVKKIIMPTENSLTYLIPQRWESDEALGDMAEYAPVLYSNKKHPDLKEKIPQWNLRAPMIAKIWRDLPEHTREAYKAQCKQNKLKKEDDQKKMLEEELKKHSSKKPKQSRGSDIAYRASVPAPPIAPVRQSQRLMSKSNNTATAAVRRSKYAEKTMMLNMKSERDKAMMAEANLPVPRVAAIQSRQAIIPKDQRIEEEIEENPPPTVYIIDHGKLVQARLNGNQRTSDSPPVQKDVNLNQNSVFYVRKSRYNEEPEKSVVMEESVLMCSECGEEFTSVSDMDSHKTLSHNYKPSVVLPKEDTALPFIKFEPVDEDFDKIENSSCYAEVDSSKGRKKKSKGKLKVKVGKSRKKSSDEAQTNCGTCDTDIKIKTEVL
uniref:Histone-lysine N-methyltransferase MLL3 n=1 Tax=Magallana gigas TaxID=29159 RepID=K1RJD9_MAGGI